MVSCTQTVTLYNKYIENRQERWQRTVIDGVSWFGKERTSVSAEGSTSADTAIIRIPESSLADYVPYPQWMVAREDWTLRNGDVLVNGAIDIEVLRGESISKVLAETEQTVTVGSIGDNRRGPLPHIRVSGGVQNANGS